MSALPFTLRGRRRAAPVALGLAALAVAAIAAATLLGGDDKSGGPKRTGAGSTATVTRRTLVERETVDGTLGYAGHRTVANRLSASNSSPNGSSPDGNSPTGDSPAADSPSDDSSDAEAAASESPASDSTISAALFTPNTAAQDSPDQDGDDSTTPDDSSPDSTTPDDSTPDDSTPDDSTPNQDKPNDQQPDGDDSDNDRDGSANDGDDDANGSQPDGSSPDGSSPDGSSPSGSSPDGSSPNGSSDDGSGDDGYQGTGTLTSMARSGSVVHRGGVLYRLDGGPIVLMYGSTPAYRTLEQGVADGPDVTELEQNLAALGFDPGTIDDAFTSATAAAIGDWQESVGLDRTGSMELGRVVFMPGPRRVGEHKATVGTVLSSGAEVLDTSSTKRVVDIPLDATKQSLARKGAAVTVTLPDGGLVKGRITKVGRVAREEQSDSADPNAQAQLVIDVTVELRSKRGIGKLDEAPVGVGLAEQARRHVLSVPVNALVARRGGGYGVELAASHRIVPVEPGLFASGYVEVSGVREGTRVVVPSE